MWTVPQPSRAQCSADAERINSSTTWPPSPRKRPPIEGGPSGRVWGVGGRAAEFTAHGRRGGCLWTADQPFASGTARRNAETTTMGQRCLALIGAPSFRQHGSGLLPWCRGLVRIRALMKIGAHSRAPLAARKDMLGHRRFGWSKLDRRTAFEASFQRPGTALWFDRWCRKQHRT